MKLIKRYDFQKKAIMVKHITSKHRKSVFVLIKKLY